MNNEFHFKPSDEFDQNMAKLVELLKKILKNNKISQEEWKKVIGEIQKLSGGKEGGVNVNLSFVNFMMMYPEDMEDFQGDFEEGYEDDPHSEDAESDLKFEINNKDQEFLKLHGIRF